ncbi:uncharacterized protein LOC124272079 isoform X2 [Haliotis rubra]|nr:uncharacterized protein LOC124272079 isoform X2 [Haliotis rubra]XP_046563176.1 uncharacterized protein LOC124272079 isoform X2 [Haliotis rubra]
MAQLCTANLGIDLSHSGPHEFVELGKIEKAKMACREGLFHQTVSCLRALTDNCTGNTEREHILRMMVDPDKSETSVNYFCQNFKTYEANAQCIANSHPEQVNCTHEVQKNFKTKVRATINMDVRMTSSCRFFKTAVSCSSKVIRRRCGRSAATVVTTIMQGFQPPKCLEVKFEDEGIYSVGDDDDDAGAAASVVTSHRLMLLVYVLICLFWRS